MTIFAAQKQDNCMYRIYFEKRFIAICDIDDPALNEPNILIEANLTQEELQKLPYEFEHSTLSRLFIPTEDKEKTLEAVSSKGLCFYSSTHPVLSIFRSCTCQPESPALSRENRIFPAKKVFSSSAIAMTVGPAPLMYAAYAPCA